MYIRRATLLIPLCCLACAPTPDDPISTNILESTGGDTSSSGASGGTATGGSGGSVSSGGMTNTGGSSGATGGATSGGSGGTTDSGGSSAETGGTTGGSGGVGGSGASGSGGSDGSGSGPGNIQYVFVIAMENHDDTSIYGNTSSAPYINGTLIPQYAIAANFVDQLALSVPSEPHYVWMEAGTNAFTDYTFTSDADPSATNSTSSTEHLSTQIDAAGALSWMSYQEGMDANTGACPIHSWGFYAPKHDPFVFFQDVSGNPPDAANAYCTAHHRALGELARDLNNHEVARYNFITPDQCNDMHGQFGCLSLDLVKSGDDWLATNMPALIDFCDANSGVVFIVWDEGEQTTTMPFIAVGPGVKQNYAGAVEYTHSSLVKSVEEIFGLPILPTVANAQDFADLFVTGAFP